MSEPWEYRGYFIVIDVDEQRGRKWTWSYTINGDHYTELKGVGARSAGIALAEAKHAAARKVDRLLASDECMDA